MKFIKGIFALFTLLLSAMTHAQEIDNITALTDQGNPAIRISFTRPHQYLTHTPTDHGDEIQVELRPLQPPDPATELNVVERKNWKASSERPLREINYERLSGTQARLTLRLSGMSGFTIKSGPDPRSLIIQFPQSQQPAGDYVINLTSSLDPIKRPTIPDALRSRKLTLYLTRAEIDGRQWNRLRLGFFTSMEEAEAALQLINQRYSQAWIDRASPEEKQTALTQDTFLGSEPGRLAGEFTPTQPPLAEGRADQLMEDARQAMASEEYDRAIRIYTKLLEHKGHDYHRDALEFLGLARERKNQLAHARAIYEDYLHRYPDGEATDRVRQRLAVLTTAQDAAQPGFAEAEDGDYPWDFFGGVSQFYRRDVSVTDIDGNQVDQSMLSSDLDFTARQQGANWNSEARITGGYDHDYLEDAEHHSRLSSFYYDISDINQGFAARLGRQTRSTGGVLGRFDGALLSWQSLPWLRLNMVSGLPVNSTQDGLGPERYFYGVSADMGTFANAWDFVAYMIEQRTEDLIDRRAIGGEVRYFDSNKSLLSLIDYDIHYNQLNTLLMLGNWTLPSRTTLNATVDLRQSPILTSTNALQGQPVSTIKELQDSFSDDEIYDLAEDRTADSDTYSLGFSHPLTAQYQVNADVTVTDFGSTPTSGGVIGTPATGNDYFYNVQLIGSSLLKEGDISILGLRYADTSTSDTLSLSLNTRYPYNSAWRLNPRARLDYRDNTNDTSQWIFSTSLRSEYVIRKLMRLELELGGEWSTEELITGSEDRSAYFAELGYRIDF